MTIDIDFARAIALLEAYGADPAHWPAEEAAALAKFLASHQEHPQIIRLLQAEQALDRALNAYTLPEAPESLADQVLARMSGDSPERRYINSPEREGNVNSPERQDDVNSPERQSVNSPERQSVNSPERQSVNSLERLLDWLFPFGAGQLSAFWRPVVAATLPLVAGLAIGFYFAEDAAFSADEELQILAIDFDSNQEWLHE